MDVPKIIVDNKSVVQSRQPNGIAGRVGVVADLGTSSTDVIVAESYRDFINKCGSSVVTANTNDFKAIKQLFIQKEDSLGATSVTVAPVGSTYSYTTFAQALDKLEVEEFDILCVPKPLAYESATINSETVSDIYLVSLKEWVASRYNSKAGVGLVFGMEESETSGQDIKSRMTDFGRGCYGCFYQTINDMTLNESIAFMCGTIAGRKLNKSLTNKVVNGIDKISPETLFGDSESDGNKYMNKGVTVLRVFNRRQGQYGVLRSVTPAGWDLSIERSADYMTREFQLKEYLGESNNAVTLDAVAGEINSKIYNFVDVLGLCEGIEQSIAKLDNHTIEIDLKYIFSGIIDLIKVYVEIELED